MTKFQVNQRHVSSVDNVVKYVLEDAEFGKNEVSVIRKRGPTCEKIIFCLPTQTNCKMGCTFCHLSDTTRPARNLTKDWIVSVVPYLLEIEGITHRRNDLLISFMGVGEPLMNIDELLAAIYKLHTTHNNIRFGISTILPNRRSLDKLIDFLEFSKDDDEETKDLRLKLHLSVHGIEHRSDLVIGTAIPAATAIRYVQEYQLRTEQPIEYHYTPVRDVNDSIHELKAFSALVATDRTDVTVKFLTLSETNGCESTKLTQDEIRDLFPKNIVEFYDPPGRDVGASCGMFDRTLYNEVAVKQRPESTLFGGETGEANNIIMDIICKAADTSYGEYRTNNKVYDFLQETPIASIVALLTDAMDDLGYKIVGK